MAEKGKRRTSFAFTLSVILHGLGAIILTLYILVEKEIIPNPFAAEFVAPPPPAKPTVRPPIVKQVPKPVVITDQPVVVQQPVTTRVTTSVQYKTTNVQSDTVLEYAPRQVRITAPVTPGPRVRVVANVPVPTVTTAANLPVADTPDALAFSAPVRGTGFTGGGTGPGIGRGVVGAGAGFGGGIQIRKMAGISLVDKVGAQIDGIGDMAKSVTIGNPDVMPLPKGEPGGRVVGRGKDIKGVFRLVRVKHNLSDWWADSSSLNALAKWLNEKTQIKTDMNVEGGAVRLTDANLMKSPLLWMTGHDPTLVQSRSLVREGGGGKLDNRLTDIEATNLRKYLVDKLGMLIFDDCGVNAPAQAMIKIFQAQMRLVMPEYSIERIPNDHEVYSAFYELGGPPVGFDIFWWGTRPPKRNFLEGMSVGDKLVAMMIRRDYMCAMESVNLPTRSVNYSPGVYRWATNVVVYSLTHGNIADYKDYVPEDTLAKQAVPTAIPQAARISSTPIPIEE